MSASLEILRVLADGQPHTVPEMAELTGMTLKQVMDGMTILRKAKCMRSNALPYVITDSGEKWLAEREAKIKRVEARKARRPRKTEAELKAAEKARMRRSIEARRQRRAAAKAELAAAGQMTWSDSKAKFVHKRVDAAVASNSIVRTAVQQQPALQAAWGAPSCA